MIGGGGWRSEVNPRRNIAAEADAGFPQHVLVETAAKPMVRLQALKTFSHRTR
nr:hypothetical protein [Candidatus Freyrarchaeum guaymaensis]